MTVTNVTQMWSKNGGSFTSEKYDQFASHYALTEGYQVLHTVDTTDVEIANATGIPLPGQQHSSGIWAFCNSVQVDRSISPIFSQVLIGYEGENPYTGAIDIEWSDSTSSEPIDRDYDGAAIVTANNEQVEGLTYELSDDVVVIRRKFLSVNRYALRAYRHAVNSDTFLGWPPGTAKLVGYQAKNQFKFGAAQELWDVTARIQFRAPVMGATAEQAWYTRWRHEGIYVRDPVSGFVSRGRDEFGQEVTKPVLLKLDGTQEYNPNNAVFIYTKLYGALPYSGLGLI
jgi:hypothetical protein